MDEYLKELAYLLRNLNRNDREESLNYYRDYLEDGEFSKYQDCVDDLGTPRSLSKQIIADRSIENGGKNVMSNSGNIKTTWLIILAILASPMSLIISLPVFLFLALIIFMIGIILFALFVIIFSFGLSAILLIPKIFGILFTQSTLGLGLLGVDLLIIGLILILIPFTVWIIKTSAVGIKNSFVWLYRHVIKHDHQKGDKK